MKISKTMLRKIIKEEIESQHPGMWSPGETLSQEEQVSERSLPPRLIDSIDYDAINTVGWYQSPSVSSAEYQGAGKSGMVFAVTYEDSLKGDNKYGAMKTPFYDPELQLWWRPTGQ